MEAVISWVISLNLFLTIIIFIVGNVLWKNYQDGKHSVDWPSTNGVIVKSYLKQVDDNDRYNGHIRHNRHFEVVVEYNYAVDGRSYTGHRIKAWTARYPSEQSASQDLENYKPGKPVQVYYNPKKPDSSVLTPG